MWKPEHRLAGERRGLRYPSDMNDSEWTLIAPLISTGPARRTATRREPARGLEWDLLCAGDRLPMASWRFKNRA